MKRIFLVALLALVAGVSPMRAQEIQSVVIGRVQDRLCRFLTAGDVDGDGRREIVVAAHKTGLWLLRPRAPPGRRARACDGSA